MDSNNRYGLKESQEKLLETLEIYDSICRENGIFYSLHGGTLLGAERDNKMIPWDDDVDVSMDRPYFEKLVEAIKTRDDCKITYLDLWVPRFVYYKNGEMVEHVDILVWDYISEKKMGRVMKLLELKCLQGMIKKEVVYKGGIITKLMIFTTHIMGKPFSYEKKLKWYKNVEINKHTGRKLFTHRSNDVFGSLGYIFDSDYTKEYSELELEGRKYYVFKRYHEFLEMSYGPNYMTPPPEKDRIPMHDTIRDKFKES